MVGCYFTEEAALLDVRICTDSAALDKKDCNAAVAGSVVSW